MASNSLATISRRKLWPVLVAYERIVANDTHTGPRTMYAASLDRQQAVEADAHDLCNHLQVISSAVALLERSIHGKVFEGIDLILDGAKQSLKQAQTISRRAVDSAEYLSPAVRQVSIPDRLATLSEVILLAAGPLVAVVCDVHADVPDIICCPEALDSAILNIVVNASHAMPEGGHLAITVTCEPPLCNAFPFAVIRIADTGCGMSGEVAARAFEARFTTRRDGEGSGVGLSMVASFARSAGGTAWIESAVGMGTAVMLRLPGVLKTVGQPHGSAAGET